MKGAAARKKGGSIVTTEGTEDTEEGNAKCKGRKQT